MSKHTARRAKRRMIRAAAGEMIHADAAGVDWVEAADGEQKKPKRFSINAYSGGVLRVSRYDTPVVIDLAGMTAQAPIPILLDHEHSSIVGHADDIDVGTASLKLGGIVSGVGDAADKVTAMAGNGFPWRASVGAIPMELEWVGDGVSTKVNGRSFKGPMYVARKSELKEVSFVAVAADSRTSAKVAASAAKPKEDAMTFEQWIEAMGLVLADLTDQQKAKLEAKYKAELEAAAKTPEGKIEAKAAIVPPKFDLAGCVLAYEKHVAGVQAEAAGYATKIDGAKLADIQAKASQTAAELKAKALNEEWAPERLEVALVKAAADTKVELIRAERPQGPAIHASTRDSSPQIIEAAFAKSAGLPNREKYYKPEVLEAADRQYNGLGLQELLLLCASANGYSGRPIVTDSNLREVIKAAFTTHTITTMLTTTGNKLLLDGFMSMPQTWREVAQVRSVSDFKTVTAFRLTTSLEYEEVGAGGEIHHGSMGQESYTMQAKTYARMLALTRQDIINDDLGAFNDLRSRLGLGAAIKMNKVFWTLWLATANGAAFWTAARGNLSTSSALAEAGLNSAVQKFRDMTAPDGNMMSLEPDRILVPSALEATARKLYVSQEVRDTTASTKFLTSNIWQNKFRPIVVPELGNSSYTGYSATNWWMLANPAILASAIMCFLNGQESPTIESADADFNTLGIQLRGYHDFGAAMSEYRASVEAQA